ncbi:L10-interacting MYB domain-containing protein-like [Cicer arietinum]|uniref:L10-interacting MYB domain-containing protein-like n=1 Tax=Cicer arietinum TaxID=3827 RepID=A0A1S2Y661_CICAR|nr:L10-interacting MYB domain-containing protein-like [Cicer arietinum]
MDNQQHVYHVCDSESEGRIVARWDDTKTEPFLKICIEEIEAGNRPDTHFSKEGWKNITEKFQKRTNYGYDRTQLKNRWDALKREFSSFAKLVKNHIGVGWDHDKQTVQADDECWMAKSKDDPEIMKWKNRGPKIIDLLEKCFSGEIST